MPDTPNPEDERRAYADMLSEYLARPPRREAFFEAYIDDPDAAPGDEAYEVRAFPVDWPADGSGAADGSTPPAPPPDPFGLGGMFQPPAPPA